MPGSGLRQQKNNGHICQRIANEVHENTGQKCRCVSKSSHPQGLLASVCHCANLCTRERSACQRFGNSCGNLCHRLYPATTAPHSGQRSGVARRSYPHAAQTPVRWDFLRRHRFNRTQHHTSGAIAATATIQRSLAECQTRAGGVTRSASKIALSRALIDCVFLSSRQPSSLRFS